MAAASAARGQGAAPAPQARGPQEEQARGAEGARPSDRDCDAVPDPLGSEALPLVVEVYEWLSWASSGTTGAMRNRHFDAVLLQRDEGNRELPPGGWATQEDHKRALWAVTRAEWPDREPTWPVFPEGGLVLRITDAEANNWLPLALRTALAHWHYRRQHPPPPQPQPPTQAATQVTAAPRRPRRWAREGGEGQVTRDAPPAIPCPLTQSASPTPRPYGAAEGRALPPVGEGGGNERGGGPTAPQPANR